MIWKKIKYPEYICIEKGYGEVLQISDEEYEACGCKIVSHEERLQLILFVMLK